MDIQKDLVAASATPLVLAILSEGESYGYAIIKRVAELSKVPVQDPTQTAPMAHRPLGPVMPFGAAARGEPAPAPEPVLDDASAITLTPGAA